MRSERKSVSSAIVVWAVFVALALAFSASLAQAQDDDPEQVLTLEELQEQREVLALETAEAAASIDVSEATIDEVEQALDELAALTELQQIRLEDATRSYNSAIAQVTQAEADRGEIVESIKVTRELVSDLALAAFTGEVGVNDGELALSVDLNDAVRFIHLLNEQTGDLADSLDRLRALEIEAEKLLVQRDKASQLAEESLAEMENRSAALTASIAEQQALLELAEARLSSERIEADALAAQTVELDLAIEDLERRLAEAVQGIGSVSYTHLTLPTNREV